MADSVEHILILRGLEAVQEELRASLGDAWPAFRRKLADITTRIGNAPEVEQARLIDELLELGLASPAAEIFRLVLRQAHSATTQESAVGRTRSYRIRAEGPTVAASPRSGAEAVRHSGHHIAEELTSRYLNLCFLGPDRRTPLPASATLAPDAEYLLRLDIGSLSPDSVVEDAGEQPFPAEQLPVSDHGHWLEVVAVSGHFITPHGRFPLFLPTSGPSWVCDCPVGSDHTCAASSRRSHLLVPVRTPSRPGEAELRLAVYFKKNVVQSLLVTAVVATGRRRKGGIRARIDYSLTARLSDVSFLEPRDLSVLTNQRGDGTHVLVFNGALDEVVALTLTEGQMKNAVGAIRAKLRSIHLEEWGGRLGTEVQRRTRYDANNAKPHHEFVADLKELALLGWWLWARVWGDRFDFWQEHREAFVKRSSVIQVARKGGSPFVFPWALIYDIPLEPGAAASSKECRLLGDQEWKHFRESTTEFPAVCPFEGEHRKGVICPFGFWGFRYLIEQPPSMPAGRALPMGIPLNRPPLELVVATSDDLLPDLRARHVAALRQRLTDFTVLECRSRPDIAAALAAPDLELVYFYCHGIRQPLAGTDVTTPSLGVGRGEVIEPEDLIAWATEWPKGHWLDTSPLVFINGCHTAELLPETLVNFVDVFAGLNAGGVIGTEITIHQQVANEAAETLLEHFQRGKTIGEALRLMRAHFLKKGNLLGLAYTPYCSVSLRLADGAA